MKWGSPEIQNWAEIGQYKIVCHEVMVTRDPTLGWNRSIQGRMLWSDVIRDPKVAWDRSIQGCKSLSGVSRDPKSSRNTSTPGGHGSRSESRQRSNTGLWIKIAGVMSRNDEGYHAVNFVVIDDAAGSCYDNLRCRQWRKHWLHDNARASAIWDRTRLKMSQLSLSVIVMHSSGMGLLPDT